MFGFGQRHEVAFDGTMRMAFCADGTFEPVGACVTQAPDDTVLVEGDSTAVAQAVRALSLDVDGRGFAEVGQRDPVIGRLQAVAPGLRPPLFYSAYEAAAWCVLSARRPVRQMQAVRARLSAEHGRSFLLAGQEVSSFPSPAALLKVTEVPGLDHIKVERLHAVAAAALEGWLDTATLRALDPAVARQQLERLPGIGPFSSQLVVVRALGHTDVIPSEEPRAMAVIGELYGLGAPASAEQLERISAPWSPFRTWALILARAASGRLREPSLSARPTQS